jgi:hypothetical protein
MTRAGLATYLLAVCAVLACLVELAQWVDPAPLVLVIDEGGSNGFGATH